MVFLVFGGFVVPAAWWNLSLLAFALFSLTVMRMLPIVLSSTGKSLRWESLFFLSWFGPRGVASILASLVGFMAEEPGGSISDAVALTVLI